MAKIEEFLNEEEQQEIVTAIQKAERNTSGEIRIHIEKSPEKDVFDHAAEVFDFLKMENTLEKKISVTARDCAEEHRVIRFIQAEEPSARATFAGKRHDLDVGRNEFGT